MASRSLNVLKDSCNPLIYKQTNGMTHCDSLDICQETSRETIYSHNLYSVDNGPSQSCLFP